MRHVLLLLLPACATLAEPGGGDVALPNAAAGPFRPIAQAELGNTRAAPYGLKDDDEFPHDLAVLDEDGDPTTLAVVAYVARTLFPEDTEPDAAAPPNDIARATARDGRSFDRELASVLAPELAWEGGTVGAPAVLRDGARTLLFYAAAGGIGLASSDDGVGFTRMAEPVLAPVGGWEGQAVPTSPSVVRAPDGSLRLYYAVPRDEAGAIGEARSDDGGASWQRIGQGPLLVGRGASGDPAAPHHDATHVGAPAVVLGVTAEGRSVSWLYYAARDEQGRGSIGLAARFGEVGPFERATAPVYTASALAPTEPAVVRFEGVSLLYVTQLAGSSEALAYPAVAVGVAPATSALGPPDPP